MSFINEATLFKMAEAEILGEAKRAMERQLTLGVSGWQPAPKANKLFLTNTVLQVLASNKLLSRKQENKSQKQFLPKKKKKERKLLQSSKDKKSNYIFKKPNQNKQQKNYSTTKKLEDSNKSTLNFRKINTRKNEFKVGNLKTNKS